MKYLAAYLLLNAAGKTPSVETISEVVAASGAEVDASQIETLLSKLDGKSVEELIAAGNEKLSSVPVGGAASASGASASGSAEAGAEEEKEESEAEESDDDMGFGLFD